MTNLDYLNQLLSIACHRLELPPFRQQVGFNGHNLSWLLKNVAPTLAPTDEIARLLSMKIEDLRCTVKDKPMPAMATLPVAPLARPQFRAKNQVVREQGDLSSVSKIDVGTSQALLDPAPQKTEKDVAEERQFRRYNYQHKPK